MTHIAGEPAHNHERGVGPTHKGHETTSHQTQGSYQMQGLADPSSAAVSFRGLGKSFGDKHEDQRCHARDSDETGE